MYKQLPKSIDRVWTKSNNDVDGGLR